MALFPRQTMLWLGICACLMQVAQAQVIRIRGSSTFEPFMQSVAEDYMVQHPGAAVIVASGGSSRGLKALLDGTAEIAMTSGDPSESVSAAIQRSGQTLRSLEIGSRPLVVVTHQAAPIRDISTAELSAVFSGRLARFPDASGKAPLMQVLIGPPGGGVTESFKNLLFQNGGTFTAKAQVVADQNLRMKRLSRLPHGISYRVLDDSPDLLKHLLIDGIAPTPDNIATGTYPLRSTLTLVTTEKPSETVQAFLNQFSTPRVNWKLDGLLLRTSASKP